MSTDQTPSIAICEADVEAEVACIKGDAKNLCAYFNRPDKPLVDVVRNIAHGLLATAENPGPGNWKLVLSTRNGRPPNSRSEPTSAAQALATGQSIPAGLYLLANPEIDEATQRILADALDPNPYGASKWQMKFKRARKGNPRPDLRTAINQALIKETTEGLHARAKAEGTETNWDKAIYPQAKRELERSLPSIKPANQPSGPLELS